MAIPIEQYKRDLFDSNNSKEQSELKDMLGVNAFRYLRDPGIQYRLIDSIILLDDAALHTNFKNKIYDWQYVYFPTCLALELALFKIAKDLGIEFREGETIGQVFNKTRREKLLSTISNQRTQEKIIEEINTLGGFIQEYRNDPFHPTSNLKAENLTQAKARQASVIEKLKSLIENLLDAGLIPPLLRPAGIRPYDPEQE